MSVKLAELDIVTPRYSVVDQNGNTLGSKGSDPYFLKQYCNEPKRSHYYLKPKYDRRGRPYGGKRASFEDQLYKRDPSWLKAEVFKVDTLGGELTFHVKM